MTPTEFLRAMAGRRKGFATGGEVHSQAPMQLGGCTFPAQRVWIGDQEMPPGTRMEIQMRYPEIGVTAAVMEANLREFTLRMRHGDQLVRCGCWGRYSDCRCQKVP